VIRVDTDRGVAFDYLRICPNIRDYFLKKSVLLQGLGWTIPENARAL
jgi:hypothetical protein